MTLKTLLLGLTAAAAIAVPGVASAQYYDHGRGYYGRGYYDGPRYDGRRDYRHHDRWDRRDRWSRWDRYRWEQRRRWARERRHHRHYRDYDRGGWNGYGYYR
ncbi:hypothetical protein LZK98_13345 [Sphingomonas cannabina]|uniref:hypothetical protein n=1 Tax=Sphingomonas cannabina TaxID=2899123 RepID=UPI001F467F42|nr:hypothetical protein [Sphingomonas cannabina]UIJ44062.1 hypothetical protein LZK98_13345 [Sphingomonas cannabina]